jgi:hypothetical protein
VRHVENFAVLLDRECSAVTPAPPFDDPPPAVRTDAGTELGIVEPATQGCRE